MSDSEALDVTPSTEQNVLLLLQSELRVADLNRNVGVAALLEVHLLAEIEVLTANTFVISAQSTVFSTNASILFADTGKLTLCVLESQLLVPKVGAAAVQELLSILNAGLCARELKVKRLELI